MNGYERGIHTNDEFNLILQSANKYFQCFQLKHVKHISTP